MAEKRPSYDEQVRVEAMTESEATAALIHEVLTALASESGIGYCRVLKRVGFEPGEL